MIMAVGFEGKMYVVGEDEPGVDRMTTPPGVSVALPIIKLRALLAV